MRDRGPNLSASVLARLRNEAERLGDEHQALLTRYCLERFLHRLGVSEACDRYVLKGAVLLSVWSDHPYRATRDLDLLRRGGGEQDAIEADLGEICGVHVVADGLRFDRQSLRVEEMRHQGEYSGVRATLAVRCSTARNPLQVDVGVGDAVWPSPSRCVLPALLPFPPAEMLAYPKEAVIAEKFEALVVLGERNSRIKDYFDIDYLCRAFEFDRSTLREAVARTFLRRRTPIPVDVPVGLTDAYWKNPTRPAQIRAFARRAGLPVLGGAAESIITQLRLFLLPLLVDLRTGSTSDGRWISGGPWV